MNSYAVIGCSTSIGNHEFFGMITFQLVDNEGALFSGVHLTSYALQIAQDYRIGRYIRKILDIT